jgi:hypothetical protein
MDLSGRLAALGRIGPASTPVVTVYLGTRWVHQPLAAAGGVAAALRYPL